MESRPVDSMYTLREEAIGTIQEYKTAKVID